MAATSLPAEPQASTTVTPSYRRNGKLFSCEPCRKGKLRCDHASPICGRCARRNKPDQCIYHPAPLTKPRASGENSNNGNHSRTSTSHSRTSSIAHPSPAIRSPRNGLVSPPSSATPTLYNKELAPLRPQTAQPFALSPALATPQPGLTMSNTPATSTSDQRTSSSTYASPTESGNMSFRDSRTGFLGATSYNAVFTENPGSLSVIMEPHDTSEEADKLPPVPPEKIVDGAQVLSMLRDLPTYQKFTQRFFDSCDGIIVAEPAYKIWIDELWSEFGRLLQEGNEDQLRSLSELVWRNTRRPMKVHGQMSAREWARSASGRNLRFEVVGIIFTLVGLIAVNLSCWDSMFESIGESFVDRETFVERMRKAAEYCLCFCYESEVLNDLYVQFLYEDLVLVECIKGDAHYISWQRTGELIDAIVAMGLHQGNPVDPTTPFFLSEMRKKVFASAYGRDKTCATFLGRPPRLSHRYCKMELPLDLSHDELFLEGPELGQVLSTLDADGWNTSGNLHRTTWQRVWCKHCRIREDILEIALGAGGDDGDISFQAARVRQKMEALNASFPDFMSVLPEDILSDGALSLSASGYRFGRAEQSVRVINALFIVCIHAGIAQTEFLLQRALVNRGEKDTRGLIPISRRLLRIVLLAQSKRDYFRDFQGDLTYLMAVHGLSAAGVLAIELLKQEQSPQAYANLSTPDSPSPSAFLPRSETIQELSVFISSLATVSPGEGNFFICNQGRRALKRVLDQILAPPPAVRAPFRPPEILSESADATGMGGLMPDGMAGDVGGGVWFPTGNDVDFLSWLDNVEWDKAGVWGGMMGGGLDGG